LANINLQDLLRNHLSTNAAVTLSVARPKSRFGVVETGPSGVVQRFLEKPEGAELVNIGYMIAEPALMEELKPGQALEDEPLRRLVDSGKLGSHLHEGFWQPMDTQRELEMLNALWDSGDAPWAIWENE
jgi:glucose-1-phosphate cytidylyltransferase